MPAPRTTILGILLAVAVAGCGGAGPSDLAGGPPSQAPAARAVVVSADLDGDGVTDLAVLDRAGIEPPECFRGDGEGAFVSDASLQDHPAVAAIQDDLASRDDVGVLSDDGVHRAGGSVTGALPAPYAVLHLGERDIEPEGPPTIEQLEPDRGHGGALVAIEGADLVEEDMDTTATFAGVAAEVVLAFPGYVLAIVPTALPLGSVDVVVSRGDLESNALPFEVVAQPDPVVTSTTPNPVAPGGLLLVRGEHLGTPLDDVEVDFGGTPAERLLAFGMRLIAVVPASATSGPLTVTVNGIRSAPFDLSIDPNLPDPTIASVTPDTASPGTVVEIVGENIWVLGEGTRVFFGDIRAALYGIVENGVRAIVPRDAVDGDVRVEVGERVSNSVAFDVIARGPPAITAAEPAAAAPGKRFTIRGTDLYDLAAWQAGAMPPLTQPFGNVDIRIGETRVWLYWPTPYGLAAFVPLTATSGDLTVTVGGARSNAVPFTVK